MVSDLVSQVLSGLDEDYNPVAVSIQGKHGISWANIQSDLLFYEQGLEYQMTMKTANPESVVDPSWYTDNEASSHVATSPNHITSSSGYTGQPREKCY
ncbi:uncharacterized protein LOC120068270 isoform X2 [Benincasa hispida]|uniref:uncharacterized protein LOC120068270 isoform X2 n=1 Tax=Benincasa hispida TaxID=102211 RepID=UPI0019000E1C|nr:uncharacterized protein LOC120068270 isoform X2 [Benincasa hispida]